MFLIKNVFLFVQVFLWRPMEAEAADLRGLPSGQSGPEPVRYRAQTEPEEIQPLRSFCESRVLPPMTNLFISVVQVVPGIKRICFRPRITTEAWTAAITRPTVRTPRSSAGSSSTTTKWPTSPPLRWSRPRRTSCFTPPCEHGAAAARLQVTLFFRAAADVSAAAGQEVTLSRWDPGGAPCKASAVTAAKACRCTRHWHPEAKAALVNPTVVLELCFRADGWSTRSSLLLGAGGAERTAAVLSYVLNDADVAHSHFFCKYCRTKMFQWPNSFFLFFKNTHTSKAYFRDLTKVWHKGGISLF